MARGMPFTVEIVLVDYAGMEAKRYRHKIWGYKQATMAAKAASNAARMWAQK